MRKIIVSEFVTLDGVMEAPGGEKGHPHSGWVFIFMSPEQLAYKLEEVLEAESLLIGRVTYESFAGAWPTRSGEFADKMNVMPKHVVSTTLRDPKWDNSTVIGGDVAGEVALGSGRRLFPESPEKIVLKLADTRTFASGVVVHSYHPVPTGK